MFLFTYTPQWPKTAQRRKASPLLMEQSVCKLVGRHV